jgi:hypothetical protein
MIVGANVDRNSMSFKQPAPMNLYQADFFGGWGLQTDTNMI